MTPTMWFMVGAFVGTWCAAFLLNWFEDQCAAKYRLALVHAEEELRRVRPVEATYDDAIGVVKRLQRESAR